MNEKLQAMGVRWPWLGTALATQQRFKEVNGNTVSSAITVSVFVSIFPLLLVAIAVVGFLASGDKTWATRVVDDLGLTGSARTTVIDAVARASESRRAASVVGLAGLLWSGSNVGLALQRGVRTPWQEPQWGLKDRVGAVLWLLCAALGFALAIAVTGILNWLPSWLPAAIGWLAAFAAGLAIGIGLFLWMFWGLGTRRVPVRDLLPGAIFAAVGFEVLKFVGTIYVPRLVANSSSLYGPLGVVFAILAWLMIFARLLVYASTLNAVRFERTVGRRTVAIYVPHIPDVAVLAATRGGQILTEADLKPGFEVPVPVVEGLDPLAEAATEADEAGADEVQADEADVDTEVDADVEADVDAEAEEVDSSGRPGG